ncbi:MAG: thioredoxin family protein [Verrucomicrobiota bacterium]
MKTTRYLIGTFAALALFAGGFIGNTTVAADGDLQIIKFEADWCSHCARLKPVFAKVSEAYSSDASFRSVDIDTNTSLANRYSVAAVPTIIAVKDGRVVGRLTGYQSEGKLKSFIRKHR